MTHRKALLFLLMAACGQVAQMPPPDPDAGLTGLKASAGVLDPAFSPEVTEYDLDLVYAEGAVTFTPEAPAGATIAIEGITVASGATSTGMNLAPGRQDVHIVVTSATGTTTYLIRAHRGVDALASLVPSMGTLAPSFDPSTGYYALGLPLDTSMITFTPALLTPERATMTVDGLPLDSGAASSPKALAVGDSAIRVTVTPMTRAARNYDVDVLRGTDALSSLRLSRAGAALTNPLTPLFDPATSSYQVAVGVWLESFQVTVDALSPDATITVDDVPVAAGTPSPNLVLNSGASWFPIDVTPPGGASRRYDLTVNRGLSALQRAYVKASNPGPSAGMGDQVALSGDTLVVGASRVNDGAGSDAGAAYVYARTGATWAQQAYLRATTPAEDGEFGHGVAISGDTIAVGAPGEYSGGAVYVFTRAGSVWSLQARLVGSNTESGDIFGGRVALWGDTLAIAAYNEDSAATGIGGDQSSNAATGSGAVYVFTRSGTTWTQQAYLKASNTGASDSFGIALSLWGDTLAVGASGEDSGVLGNPADESANAAGAAYVFTRVGSTWTQQAYLKASNVGPIDNFGFSLAVSGDTLAVGAFGEDGASTGINGTQTSDAAPDAGAVYVFTRSGSSWRQEAYIKASNTGTGDWFGESVALFGDALAVGAPMEDGGGTGMSANPLDNSVSRAGAVYMYMRFGTSWSQPTYVKASNTELDDTFANVALWGDTLAVGATGEDSAASGIDGDQTSNAIVNSGAVYIFR